MSANFVFSYFVDLNVWNWHKICVHERGLCFVWFCLRSFGSDVVFLCDALFCLVSFFVVFSRVLFCLGGLVCLNYAA